MAAYTDTQVMMTLAALAATGATERPSGEARDAQAARILRGINAQLAKGNLATGNSWTAIWVGLTDSRANLAYLAYNTSNGAYALALRGTMAGSPIDSSEDMEVGLMLPFGAGGMPPTGTLGNISQGAMEAFTDLTMGTELVPVLMATRLAAPAPLYVTGHSLGGALVTTVSLFLAAAGIASTSSVSPYTFAAPTAGDSNFASFFNTQFPSAKCVVNKYDLVPNAWASLTSLVDNHVKDPFYPSPNSIPPAPKGPGPTATPANAIGAMIKSVAAGTNGNTYVQPTQQPPLNAGSSPIFLNPYPPGAQSDMQKFEMQVGFQHDNNTYLTLLGAPTLPAVAPVVAAISPTSGQWNGHTTVTITPPKGVTFSPSSVVDFGIVPALWASVAADGSSITAVAPQGVGTVDVRVTNEFGTSPAVPVYPNLSPYNYNDQFTFRLLLSSAG